MPPRHLLAALVFVAAASSIFARIGETLDACVARYGHETKVTEFGHEFIKNDTRILIRFHEGKADRIVYDRATPFSRKQIDELLERNAPAKKRKTTGVQADGDLPATLETEDGSFFTDIGRYSGSRRMTVEIFTAGALLRERRDHQSKEDIELDGF